MALPEKDWLLYQPDDCVNDIFYAIYVRLPFSADHMEREGFLEELSTQFCVELEELYDMWHEKVTLGELFDKIDA